MATQHAQARPRREVDEPLAVAFAAVGGLAAALSSARPTGSTAIDAALVFLAVGAVVWASASVWWWAPAAACGVGAVMAFNPVIAAIGAVGFVVGLVAGMTRRDRGGVNEVLAAVAMNVLIRSDHDAFLGSSAVVGVAVGVVLLGIGVARRPGGVRKRAVVGLAVVGVVAVAALAAVALAAVRARPDVTDAAQQARLAVTTLNSGDYDGAAALFQASSDSFSQAETSLGGLLAAPGRLVPGVAQNLATGADLSEAASSAMEEAASALGEIDPSKLRVHNGAIDLDAVRDVEAPLARVHRALDDLRAVVDTNDSPWIIGRVRDELAELQDDFDDNEPRLQNAIDAVKLAPAMLGAEGRRTYLLLFTTPAEARGLGGFVGNFAEMEIADGRITVTRFDRRSDLEKENLEHRAFCTACDPELLQRYGRFGLNTGPNNSLGSQGWSNITMAAHFPYVAQAAKTLYPQNGGNPIDGVIVMDPYVIQALMQYTGPIEISDLDSVVQPDDAAQFILEDQYLLAGEERHEDRIDALGALGDQVIFKLLNGSIPAPPELAEALGPLVAERRLLVWTDEAAEQDLLARVGLLGALPDLGADGGFSVSVTNASGSKIEVFLEREVEVDVVVAADGSRTLVADVRFTNNAPSSGLPRYVIGNVIGQPPGSSRLFVTFYGLPTLTAAMVDGDDLELEALPEAGWMAYGAYVDLLSGESVEYHLEFTLANVPENGESPTPSEASERGPTVWEQPITRS